MIGVRHPCPEETALLRAMFRQIFADSDAYLDVFFGRKYHPSRALLAEVDGEAAGHLFWAPYDLRCGGIRYSAAYICGVATLPAFRGRSVMAELIRRAHAELAAAGVDFSVLIPAEEGLFRLYARHGYETVFDLSRTRAPMPPPRETGFSLHPVARGRELAADSAAFLASLPMAICQSADDLDAVAEELSTGGGFAYRIRRAHGAQTGYILGRADGDKLYVLEHAGPADLVRDVAPLLSARFPGVRELVALAPGADDADPFGMAAALRAARLPAGMRGYMNLMLN